MKTLRIIGLLIVLIFSPLWQARDAAGCEPTEERIEKVSLSLYENESKYRLGELKKAPASVFTGQWEKLTDKELDYWFRTSVGNGPASKAEKKSAKVQWERLTDEELDTIHTWPVWNASQEVETWGKRERADRTDDGYLNLTELESPFLVKMEKAPWPEKAVGWQRLTNEELDTIDAEGLFGESTGKDDNGLAKIILWDEAGGPVDRPKLAGDLKIN